MRGISKDSEERHSNDSGIVEDLVAAEDDEEEKRNELKNVKESMSELESALESVSESVEDFVEHFVESEHDYLVREHARLREEVNMLRDNPELVLRRLPEELWIKVHSQTLNAFYWCKKCMMASTDYIKVLKYLSIGELCTMSLVCRGFLSLAR